MAANIGDRKGIVSAQEARAAVQPLYAVDDGISIDLAHLRVVDGERVAWDVGVREIAAVASRVQERLVRDGVQHLSIFALAPIPLLMFLGRALGDIAPCEAYQRRRTPSGWSWQPANGDEVPFDVIAETEGAAPNVSLIFSVSDEVDLEAVRKAAPEQPHYIVRLSNPTPDLVRAREQVDAFRAKVREVLLRIREQRWSTSSRRSRTRWPWNFGRVLLPKSDPPMEVYDFNRALGAGAAPSRCSLRPPAVRRLGSTPGCLSRTAARRESRFSRRFSRRERPTSGQRRPPRAPGVLGVAPREPAAHLLRARNPAERRLKGETPRSSCRSGFRSTLDRLLCADSKNGSVCGAACKRSR